MEIFEILVKEPYSLNNFLTLHLAVSVIKVSLVMVPNVWISTNVIKIGTTVTFMPIALTRKAHLSVLVTRGTLETGHTVKISTNVKN